MNDRMASPLYVRAAVVLGCGTLFLAMVFAFRSNDRVNTSPPFVESQNNETMNLREELLRCDALDLTNVDDPHCNAVWAENNRRFFRRSMPPVTNVNPVTQPKIEGAAR